MQPFKKFPVKLKGFDILIACRYNGIIFIRASFDLPFRTSFESSFDPSFDPSNGPFVKKYALMGLTATNYPVKFLGCENII